MSNDEKIATMAVDSHTLPVESQSTSITTEPKRPWWYSVKEPGSAIQIVICAAVAIGIGMAVVSTVDEVPQAAIDILGIPGGLWLRALKAVGMLQGYTSSLSNKN
jgi:hypothetical protein